MGGYSDDRESDEQLTLILLHLSRRPGEDAPPFESQRLSVVRPLVSDLVRDTTGRGRFSTDTPDGRREAASTFPGIGLRR